MTRLFLNILFSLSISAGVIVALWSGLVFLGLVYALLTGHLYFVLSISFGLFNWFIAEPAKAYGWTAGIIGVGALAIYSRFLSADSGKAQAA